MGKQLIIEDFDDKNFDPFKVVDAAGYKNVTDVFPELRRLRHECPLQELDHRAHFNTMEDSTTIGIKKWTALGQPLVHTILTDSSRFTNTIYKHTLGKFFGRSITTMDAPEHRDYRFLFQPAFSPSMLGKWEADAVPALVNRLIDNFIGKGEADLVSEMAVKFPFIFIMELLELPEEYQSAFQRLAICQTMMRFDQEHATEAIEKLLRYIRGMISERRLHPVSDRDFVHVIANAKVNGKMLPDDILEGFFRQLMNAGGDTSYHGFSSMMHTLLTHPDQFDAIREDRSLIPQALDECLRFQPPVLFVERSVLKPFEYEGKTVMPGDQINVCVGDANRDEAYIDDPDTFNIFREQKRHYAFGSGSHVCIGQHLARMEITVALNALMDRLPNLRLDPDKPVHQVYGIATRKPEAVHIIFDA